MPGSQGDPETYSLGAASSSNAGQRTLVGDHVDVFNGFTLDTSLDYTLQGSLGPLTFSRFYTSYELAWDDENAGSTLTNVPGPFGKAPYNANSILWWHNYYSFVTQLSDESGNPTSPLSVRSVGGGLLFFDRCTNLPCWATPSATNIALRERLYQYGTVDNPKFMLLAEDGRRMFYESKYVVEQDALSQGNATSRLFLTRMQTAAGQTVATLSYAMPPDELQCPQGDEGTQAGVPYLSRVTNGDGHYFGFTYTSIEGIGDCAISGIQSQDGQTQVQYQYQTPPDIGYQVGLLGNLTRQPGTAASYSETFVNTYQEDVIDGGIEDGFLVLDKPNGTALTRHHYGDTGAPQMVTESNGLYEDLLFSEPYVMPGLSQLQPSSPATCVEKARYSNTIQDVNACIGDGTDAGTVFYKA